MSSKSKEGVLPSGSCDLSVREELECIICLDFSASPIHSCTNGHILCGLCVDKLAEKRCSICKTGLSVLSFGERMARKLEIRLACLNGAEGCKKVVLSTKLKKHLEVCEFRSISCQEGFCRRRVPFSQYYSHFQQNHLFPLHLFGTNKEVEASSVFTDPIPGKLMLNKMVARWNGNVFLEKKYRSQSTVYMTAELLGSKEEADKLRYLVTVRTYGPGPKMMKISNSYEVPIFPIHSNDDGRKPLAYFVAIPTSLVKQCGPEDINRQFLSSK